MLNVRIRWVVCIGLLIGTFFPYASAQGAAGGGSAPIVTVIADGLGATIDSAVQNAAQNALTQVVGSFVDTETQVEKHNEIVDGIHHQTRDISSKTREYSQGSIKSFDVLDSGQDGAIVHVTAKVAVQVEVLHEQLKQALAGTTGVSKGLFAQAETAQTQQANAESMFIDRIVTPLTQGAGLSLKVGAPVKFDMDAAHLPCHQGYVSPLELSSGGKPPKPSCPDSLGFLVNNRPLDNIYAIPVTLTADPGTATMLWGTVTSMTSVPCVRLNLNDPNPFSPLSAALAEQARQANDTSPYRPKNRYVAVVQRSGESSFGEGCYRMLTDSANYDTAMNGFARFVFQVSIYDQQSTLVEQYLFHPYSRRRTGGENEAISLDFRPAFFRISSFPGQQQFDVFLPPKNQSFDLLMHVSIEVLRRAERVEIKVVSE